MEELNEKLKMERRLRQEMIFEINDLKKKVFQAQSRFLRKGQGHSDLPK